MPAKTEAGKWLEDRGLTWKPAKPYTQAPRDKRAHIVNHQVPVREFCEWNTKYDGDDCLIVPGATERYPARVTRWGKSMRAGRYMLILTQGAPNSEGMHARHLCGNGHLSCVNPKHLAWGSPGDNIADANKHRAAERRGETKLSVFD